MSAKGAPATLAEFAVWLRSQLADLDGRPDQEIFGSGRLDLPIASAKTDGPATRTVYLHSPDPLYVLRELLLDSVERLLPADQRSAVLTPEMTTLRQLRTRMRDCLAAIEVPDSGNIIRLLVELLTRKLHNEERHLKALLKPVSDPERKSELPAVEREQSREIFAEWQRLQPTWVAIRPKITRELAETGDDGPLPPTDTEIAGWLGDHWERGIHKSGFTVSVPSEADAECDRKNGIEEAYCRWAEQYRPLRERLQRVAAVVQSLATAIPQKSRPGSNVQPNDFDELKRSMTEAEFRAVAFLGEWIETTRQTCIMRHDAEQHFQAKGCDHPLMTFELLTRCSILKKRRWQSGAHYTRIDPATGEKTGAFHVLVGDNTVFEITDRLWAFLREVDKSDREELKKSADAGRQLPAADGQMSAKPPPHADSAELLRPTNPVGGKLSYYCGTLVYRAILSGTGLLEKGDAAIAARDAGAMARVLRDIEDYCRVAGHPLMGETSREQLPADAGETGTVAASGADKALAALLAVFTNGISDDRIKQAAALLSDTSLSVNEKLTKIDALIPFPPTASAEKLGSMLGGVKRQAVAQSEWWIQNRKGEKQNEIGRRQTRHREQSKRREYAPEDDDE